MSDVPAPSLAGLIEPLVAISIRHLSPETRHKLAADALSVNAYPNEYGGFIYVGNPRYEIPAEADLAEIFAAAEQARVIWLKVDRDAAIVDGLPVYEDDEETP